MSRTRRRGPTGEKLTIFGEWVDTLIAILRSNYKEVAAYTDEPRMDPSTISRLARKPGGPTPESVPRIWKALYRIAEERDKDMDGRKRRYTDMLSHITRDGFYNSGGIVSEFQRDLSVTRLRILQVYLDMIQENSEKDEIIRLLEEQVILLSQEIKRLRP